MAQAPPTWQPCEAGPAEGAVIECATLEMPVDHRIADGPTMDVGVRRVRGEASDGRQLWYLAGGPGDAVGNALIRLAAVLDDPGLDLYGVDHRGTGASAVVECPDEQAATSDEGSEISSDEWASCIAYLERERSDLEFLTTTQSAMDLGLAIERLTQEDERAFVFGASYGSYWAMRYLHLFPDQPAGVILDGLVPPDWSFAEFDASLDRTGRAWLRACDDDPACSDRFESGVEVALESVLGRLAEGHCPAVGADDALLRVIMGVVLMVDDLPKGLFPALTYRFDRCAWQDQAAVAHLLRFIGAEVGESSSHSPALQRHVALSELWNDTDPAAETLEAALEETVMTTAVSASFAETYPIWPRYAADPFDGRYAEAYEGPLLMLHGSLDPTMLLERVEAFRDRYAGVGQTFVAIPGAGHVTLNYSDCARGLYAAFLTDPVAELDLGCAGFEELVDVSFDAEAAEVLLGTTDVWGDNVTTLDTLWYMLRYRWGALAVGFLGAFSLVTASGGLRRRPSVLALSVALLVFGAVSVGSYAVTASIPLLMDYRVASATGTAILVLLVHFGIGRAIRAGLWRAGRARAAKRPQPDVA